MLICVVADVHIGNHRRFGGPIVGGLNARCRMAIDVFERALAHAAKLDAPLFVCGDLFDVAKPSPPVVRAVMDVIARSGGSCVGIVRGNHDMNTSVGVDDALAPLEHLSNVVVYRNDATHTHGDFLLSVLPYGSHELTSMRLNQRLKAESDMSFTGSHVILGHFGVSDANTPFFLRGTGGSIPADQALEVLSDPYGRALVVGDWHMEGDWTNKFNARVTQCGALVPTGFDNPGHAYGSVVELNTNTLSAFRTRLSGPRFEQHNFEAFEDDDIMPSGDQVFVSFTCARKNRATAFAKIRELQAAKLIVDGAVETDGEVQRATAKAAALAAGNASSIRDQVAAYVSKVSIPDGVTRDEVLNGVMRHVGKS